MQGLRDWLGESPVKARIAPFIVFIVLTSLQGWFGDASFYWMYALKTFVGVALVWAMWPLVQEMRWAFSWEAVVAGILVFALWVGLDPYYPKFGKAIEPKDYWNPHLQFGQDSAFAWAIVIIRILGSGLVVPPIEEVFYRSFLYRYIIKVDFLALPIGVYNLAALLIVSGIFGVAHYQWLGGILCALIYQGLVIHKNRLGDAMTAHAITNILLGIYVAWKNQWQFW